MSRAGRRAALEAVVDRSGVATLLTAAMPAGGRPRQLGAAAVLIGMLFALDAGRPAHLVAGWEALGALDVADQVRLGVAVTRKGVLRSTTYRQLSHTHQVMTRAIDPQPVPSFRGVETKDRATHLVAARRGVDAEAAARLVMVLDALVEASVPDAYKQRSTSLAVDWTDLETWSRPRGKDDPAPANDPDASWGHAKRNAPGAPDHLFFGYYAQVATMVADDRGPAVPELVRRVAFSAPRSDPAAVMTTTLVRAFAAGVTPGDVLADCGYSNRGPQTFALPLRRAGARLVMDLHPNDRGPHGTFGGAVVANGNLYCPATPSALLALGPLARGASDADAALHDDRAAELARYKLGRIAATDGRGQHRVMCPALLGKVRCPQRPASMVLDYARPDVRTPPEHPPRCCTQQTISVPEPVLGKTAQKHDYASKAHRLSYNRRTGAERTFAWLADPATIGIRRGWSRLFGLTKNALMYALAVVVRNVRLVDSFERAHAAAARRAATDGGIGRRRRRRRHPEAAPAPEPPAAAAAPQTPG